MPSLPNLTQPVSAWASWLGLRISLFSGFISLWCSFGRRSELTEGRPRTDTESRTSESPFNLLIMRQGEWPPARTVSAERPSVFLCLYIYHRSSTENFLNSCLLSFPSLPSLSQRETSHIIGTESELALSWIMIPSLDPAPDSDFWGFYNLGDFSS